MSLLDNLRGMIQQYAGGAGAAPDTENTFQQVAGAVPQGTLSGAISDVFRSDQTPALGNLVSGMFGNSNGEQRAGLLNTLLASLGPSVLSGVLAKAGAGNIAGMINGGQQFTPEMASQVPSDAVHQAATAAEQHDPSVFDRMGNFYSQHPTLVQTLGAGALAVILGKMGNRV